MQIQKLKQILTRPVFVFKVNYSKLNPKNYNWEKIKRFLKMLIIITAAVFMILLTFDLIKSDFLSSEEEDMELATSIGDMVIQHLDENYFTPEDEVRNCNVSGITLHGNLWTYISPADYDTDGNLTYDESSSEDIVYYIDQADKDEKIKAIILEVDSYGGGPTAGEEVANALKNAEKPTVALIREGGASAAYWAATGADIIFASKNSDVGSIGVTYSYLDNTIKNQKEGLTYQQLSSGKFKDTGDPNKPLTAEDKELYMRDIKIIYENFVKAVAENRNLDIKKVESLADGSTVLGQMALENGLIDQVGGEKEVKEYLKEKIGEDVEICW